MKKNLVFALVLVFVLSISGAAFAAANPFVDVPAKHWAYDAVSKLAKAGIVDGYGDGTFRGDKTMTRYEMAQIVAKAMAKSDKADAEQKAMIDKLSVEFAAELNNLGVRVTKLEKNASNIKFSADVRMRYDNLKDSDGNTWRNRFRLNMNADVNDKMSFYGRYQIANDEFGVASSDTLTDLALTQKGLFGNTTSATFGRYSLKISPTGISDTTGGFDGIRFDTKSGKTTFLVGYANASINQKLATKSTSYTTTVTDADGDDHDVTLTDVANVPKKGLGMKDVAFAEYNYNFGKVLLNLEYIKNIKNRDASSLTNGDNYNIFGGGLKFLLNKDWSLSGEYYKNTADNANFYNGGEDPTATIGRLTYKGAVAAQPKTWGAYAEYNKFEANALPYGFYGPKTKAGNYTANGLKSWVLGTSYTLAKNVVFEGYYQFNMKDADGNDLAADKFTRLEVNFFF